MPLEIGRIQLSSIVTINTLHSDVHCTWFEDTIVVESGGRLPFSDTLKVSLRYYNVTTASNRTFITCTFSSLRAYIAMASGSPDDSGRQAALPWTPDVSESATEALQALDTYKKKDPSKGQRCSIGVR